MLYEFAMVNCPEVWSRSLDVQPTIRFRGLAVKSHGSTAINYRFCPACASHEVKTFNGEMGIRVPGIENINVPAVFLFPELSVCLTCGAAQFAVSKDQLTFLRNGKP